MAPPNAANGSAALGVCGREPCTGLHWGRHTNCRLHQFGVVLALTEGVPREGCLTAQQQGREITFKLFFDSSASSRPMIGEKFLQEAPVAYNALAASTILSYHTVSYWT